MAGITKVKKGPSLNVTAVILFVICEVVSNVLLMLAMDNGLLSANFSQRVLLGFAVSIVAGFLFYVVAVNLIAQGVKKGADMY